MSKKRFELYFKKKHDVMSAMLPPEACKALLDAPCCIPYSKNGKRGLLYCGAHKEEEAAEVLRKSVEDSPLVAHVINQVMHLIELDDATGELCIPRAAARFAHIEGPAVLTVVSRYWVYLQAKEAHGPKEGKVIQLEF